MFTRPNAIAPFQSARAMARAGARRTPTAQPPTPNANAEFGSWSRLLRRTGAERPLSFEPIVEIAAVFAPALQIAAIGSLGDFLGARRAPRGAVDVAGDPHVGCGIRRLRGPVGGRRPVAWCGGAACRRAPAVGRGATSGWGWSCSRSVRS